jgi:hypothetical protein
MSFQLGSHDLVVSALLAAFSFDGLVIFAVVDHLPVDAGMKPDKLERATIGGVNAVRLPGDAKQFEILFVRPGRVLVAEKTDSGAAVPGEAGDQFVRGVGSRMAE